MSNSGSGIWPVGRALAGVFAGGVFGMVAQLLFFWDGPPEDGILLPVVGPVVGGSVVGALAVAVGGMALPDWPRRVAFGLICGVVLGVCCGAFIYAPWMTSLDPDADDVFWGKVEASYQRAGVLYGGPLGALIGMAAVVAWSRQPRGNSDNAEEGTGEDRPSGGGVAGYTPPSA
jgi:hypothetical protein